MDSPKMTMTNQPSSAPSSNHENPRVKFLCSFSGCILPRPKDGKLRYVGGETRIVSVPRDITYEELMGKMRELFEAATVLKYQQPDEDLDALVSVVNDDDVTNMMEEYDKLGSCDGFTRVRIFLFSHLDQDASVHFGAGDERDSERRYVDALNSLNESPESWKQQLSDFQVTGAADDIHSTEQYFNQMSIEGSLYDQRNFDIPQINLHHLTIPRMGSGQHQQSIMDPSWSPTCYSPRQPGHHDSRPITEFLTSPTSAVYRTPYGDFTDKNSDRMPEEYKRHPVSHQSSYDPQSRSDNLVYVPAGPVSNDKSCFPWNKTQGPVVFEGNSICENCRVAFQRNQAYPDSTWKYGEPAQLEAHSVIGNGFHPVPSLCGECLPNREMVMLNACTKLSLPFYPRELNDPRLVCNETQTHDRGWILQPHLNSSVDEPRSHISGVGRLNDHYTIDSNGMNIPIENGNLSDGHYLSQHYVHHEDPRLLRLGPDMANEAFHDQAFATGSHIHIPLEDRGGRYGNLPYAYGMDNHHQMSHGHGPPHTLWRNVHNPVHGSPFELSSFPQQKHGMVGPGLMRGTLECSPLYPVSVESQSPLVESSQKTVGTDGPNVSEYSHSHSLKCNPNTYNQEHQYPHTQECIQSPYDTLNISAPSCPMPLTDSTKSLIGEKLVSQITSVLEPTNDNQVNGSTRLEKDIIHREKETNKVEDANMKIISGRELNNNSNKVASLENIISTCLGPSMDSHSVMEGEENDVQVPCEDERPANVHLSFLSGLIESVKKAAIGGVQEVKASVQENPESFVLNETQKEEIQHEPEATGEVDLDSDNDNSSNTKIEPTQAEAEAIAKGLQTIKNDDLEEIRELGFGTYGAVYHGKWRGSDVAIKRIKASCFAGKPSERDRLIADFWKEALILSSLHHPNVVSFYGIVRDGPDGSLATVTEFMVNGSLKQFLRKKDRTIDRRKRLIIAMDAAFGMEYLHGKNIVHFDLKCENLLVNMRDPHRPVCKIGDLGLSKVKQHTLVSGGVRGTLPWMAPELLSGKSNMVTEKVDVYSFGVVMWELLTGDEPYADMHCASIIGGIVNNSLRPEIPSWCDPEWKALLESCWASDPGQRPSFSEISQRLRNMAAAINVK